jgi:hypothetical protein
MSDPAARGETRGTRGRRPATSGRSCEAASSTCFSRRWSGSTHPSPPPTLRPRQEVLLGRDGGEVAPPLANRAVRRDVATEPHAPTARRSSPTRPCLVGEAPCGQTTRRRTVGADGGFPAIKPRVKATRRHDLLVPGWGDQQPSRLSREPLRGSRLRWGKPTVAQGKREEERASRGWTGCMPAGVPRPTFLRTRSPPDDLARVGPRTTLIVVRSAYSTSSTMKLIVYET